MVRLLFVTLAVASGASVAETLAARKRTAVVRGLPKYGYSDLRSVPCLTLREKVQDPTAPCTSDALEAFDLTAGGATWSSSNFPLPTDRLCNSEGQLLCDPDRFLDGGSKDAVVTLLNSISSTLVKCRKTGRNESETENVKMKVGAVILTHFDDRQQTMADMSNFARDLQAQWGMIPEAPQCTSSGMLVFVQSSGRAAYVPAEPCDFFCGQAGHSIERAVEDYFAAYFKGIAGSDRATAAKAMVQGLAKIQAQLNKQGFQQDSLVVQESIWSAITVSEQAVVIIARFALVMGSLLMIAAVLGLISAGQKPLPEVEDDPKTVLRKGW